MTPELAQLLDGPVSERFGRPKTAIGTMMALSGDVWCSDSHNGEQCKCCPSNEAQYHADYHRDVPEAAALWLAHLLGVCGERGWGVQLDPLKDGRWMVHFGEGTVTTAPTLLEALASAMMAVQEDK